MEVEVGKQKMKKLKYINNAIASKESMRQE